MPELSPAVRVRMYRQGLGDCFLITFLRGGNKPCHLLIDCGVLLGTPNAETVMNRVARDIARATGGRLDVVVVTHAHWDHVSGFLQAREVFDDVKIGEVWLAWTEDPADALAERLRQERRQTVRGLRTSAGRLTSLAGVDAGQAAERLRQGAERLRGLLGQFGGPSGPGTRDALAYLIDHPSRPRVYYHRAGGEPPRLPGGGETRVHVLGPPRESSPTGGGKPTRADRTTTDVGPGLALFAATGGLAPEDGYLAELSHAFEARYRLPAGRAAVLPLFREHYLHPDEKWRRIDNDWLDASEQVALVLDNHTKNTSLVLAIELEPGGRVLLFPGDAQGDNWRSWKDYRWRRSAPPTSPVTAADLLSRTVLYKVGHHGSHNATLREEGLELMTSRDLAALLPVCRDTAERMQWNMPFSGLVEQLRRKTRGRLMRADEGMPVRPDEVGEAEWAAFSQCVHVAADGLSIEYKI